MEEAAKEETQNTNMMDTEASRPEWKSGKCRDGRGHHKPPLWHKIAAIVFGLLLAGILVMQIFIFVAINDDTTPNATAQEQVFDNEEQPSDDKKVSDEQTENQGHDDQAMTIPSEESETESESAEAETEAE